MNLTFDDIQNIRDDELELKEITSIVHTTYAILCSLAKIDYASMKPEDEEDEEEEENLSASRELIAVGDLLELNHLSSCKNLANPDDTDFDLEEEMRKIRAGQDAKDKADDEEFIEIEGVRHTKKDSQTFSLKDLFRMIRQASHPDKIMRFSAGTKEKILECFHDAKEHYADDNYPALMLCYVEIFLLRNDPRVINYYVWQYIKLRHIQIKTNIKFIMDKPYMPAIMAYRKGQIKAAVILFRNYCDSITDDPTDDMDCFD